MLLGGFCRRWLIRSYVCSIERHCLLILTIWAPGPELGAVLGSVDRSRLNGHDLVWLLRAQARQIAHLQAQQLATMVEISYCPPGDASSPVERDEAPGRVRL